MEESKKIYWKGLEELRNDTEFVKKAHDEFPAGPEEDLGHSRRDFLKMMGFGVAAVSLAACEAPIRNAIPYAVKPEEVDPSIANYYASSYVNGGDYCSIVVKTREGRPIKIEGNSLSSISKGGTSAQVEASVLSLYDNDRLKGPLSAGKKIAGGWKELDENVISKLNGIASQGGQIRVVTNSILSPSFKKALRLFTDKYPTAKIITYDQSSCFGMVKANEESFNAAVIPSYDFSKARVIVSIAADFLGSWLAPIEFTKQYAETRKVSEANKTMSRHYQFESILTMSGANADYRTPIKPSEEGGVILKLYNLIAAHAGETLLPGGSDSVPTLDKAAADLWENRGQSLMVAGSNDKAIQTLVNGINAMLGNYGTTVLPELPMNYRQGDDIEMVNFVEEVHNGGVKAVIFYNCNPAYDHPLGDKLAAAIKKCELTVSTSYKQDETATLSQFVAPDHHFLESWNDAEPKKNFFSLSQPTITPIYMSRSAGESFMTWAGVSETDYFEFVKNNWKEWFYNGPGIGFQKFWDQCLFNGVYEPKSEGSITATDQAARTQEWVFDADTEKAATDIVKNYRSTPLELVVFENATIGNGSQANNPLLQELPDPITKAVWDHYVTISQKDANGLKTPESKTVFASITVNNGRQFELPVLIQPGQAEGTIGIALGYGRTQGGKVAEAAGGVNAYPFLGLLNGSLSYSIVNIKFELTSKPFQLAQTQTHQTYMGRQTVVKEYTLEEFKENPEYVKDEFNPQVSTWKADDHKVDPGELSLWKGHKYRDHHWGMSIDLNACIGCGACVVACNVENNVALVGREEVINRREMHWLRIDRYYSSSGSEAQGLNSLEEAAANPEVVFQPMLCQHCNNAPCETVCPVAATTHSSEGLNQMTYNRCIGTRYCANNCPYKVRRFNWFKYHDNDQFKVSNVAQNSTIGKMVLNPDVTVRSRGVMEKCSFCVQRVQSGKLKAKREGRPMKDGDVVTACQASCSTGAIVFGDLKDPKSKISKLLQITPNGDPDGIDKIAGNPRAYQVLEEIGVKPNIWYLSKIRNVDQKA